MPPKNGNKYLAWAFVEAANFARRYCPQAKSFYERKKRKANGVLATKALAHKLARACYHVCANRNLSMGVAVLDNSLAKASQGTGLECNHLNDWTPSLRHLMECRLLNRPSREPLNDWRRHGNSHRECTQPLGHGLAPTFSGWHKPPGRSQSIAASLIPMGVWCDSVRNRRSEKTDAVRVCRKEGGGKSSQQGVNAIYLRRFDFVLDSGRLMGVRGCSFGFPGFCAILLGFCRVEGDR